MTARECAYVSLKRYENSQKYLNIEADSTIKRETLSDADKKLYTALFYGTVERKITLDYMLGQLCDRALSEVDENVLLILRLSLYQLYFLDRVPDYAVLNDAGQLTRRFAADSAVSFVNGVLRQAIRKKDLIRYPDPKREPVAYLSVHYGYPAWLCNMWCDAYGMQQTEAILREFDTNPTMTLRVNTEKTTRQAVLDALYAAAIGADHTLYARSGIRLHGHVPVEMLACLANGDAFVQDEASQLCCEIFDPQPGETIMDACACPGGKSFSAAMLMKNSGRIECCDLHANKLSLVVRGADKLGISILHTQAHSGSIYQPEWDGAFDRVLCDVPCSGLGVLAKKPDIRHKDPAQLQRLPQIQAEILSNCSRYVRPGGILQYSTCTLLPAENEEIVRQFLGEHPAFSLDPFSAAGKDWNGMMTLMPDQFHCDGFFVAKLTRRE